MAHIPHIQPLQEDKTALAPCNVCFTVPEEDWQEGREGRQAGKASRAACLARKGLESRDWWLAGSGGWQGLVEGLVGWLAGWDGGQVDRSCLDLCSKEFSGVNTIM